MTDMVASVSTDLDGDGKMTADDRLGLLKESPDYFLVGLGVFYTENNEEGIPEVACINERTIEAIEALHKMFDMPNCTLSFDESARGRHVGKSLFEHVRNYAQTIGCHNITLNVWAGNDAALSFYQNMGMQVQKTTMEIVLC